MTLIEEKAIFEYVSHANKGPSFVIKIIAQFSDLNGASSQKVINP